VQAVKHYEISRYGTLVEWAEELGHSKAVKLLNESLEEVKATDKTLSQLAQAVVKLEAHVEAAE
jgi:ferritin-like metal-binding protein YciE